MNKIWSVIVKLSQIKKIEKYLLWRFQTIAIYLFHALYLRS